MKQVFSAGARTIKLVCLKSHEFMLLERAAATHTHAQIIFALLNINVSPDFKGGLSSDHGASERAKRTSRLLVKHAERSQDYLLMASGRNGG